MNLTMIIGNATDDAKVSQTPSGVAVCRLNVAVNRPYTNQDGNREVDFFPITLWRTQAELVGKYVKKGNKVAVTGSMQSRTYEDNNGAKRTVWELIAREVEFLSPKSQEEQPEPAKPKQAQKPQVKKPILEELADMDLDIPF